MDETADVRDAAFDPADAEVAACERIELDRSVACAASIMPFEPEVPMGAVAYEGAAELLIETAPAPPCAGHDAGAYGAAIEGHAVKCYLRRRAGDRVRSCSDGAAEE